MSARLTVNGRAYRQGNPHDPCLAVAAINAASCRQSAFGEGFMKVRISRAAGLAAALATLPLFAFSAAAQLAVSSNDNKAVLVNGVNTVPDNPAEDTVTIVDLNASPPKVVGEVKAPSSVVGPPQNVAVTPDEAIALVSSNQKLDPSDPKKLVADNRLSVIDLKANPPAVIATLELGSAPAGIGMNRA